MTKSMSKFPQEFLRTAKSGSRRSIKAGPAQPISEFIIRKASESSNTSRGSTASPMRLTLPLMKSKAARDFSPSLSAISGNIHLTQIPNTSKRLTDTWSLILMEKAPLSRVITKPNAWVTTSPLGLR